MNAKRCKKLRGEAKNIQEWMGRPLTPVARYKAKYHTRTVVSPVFDKSGKVVGLDDMKQTSTQVLLSDGCLRREYKDLKKFEKTGH